MARTSRAAAVRKTSAAKSDNSRACPVCGQSMRRARRADTIEYKGLSRRVTQPGWYCGNCGEPVLEPADVKATEPAYFDLKAEAEGLVTAEEVKRIRRTLGLSQREAGEVLGGGPPDFHKNETRTHKDSNPMSKLSRLLERHPKALRELTENQDSRRRLASRQTAASAE